MADNFLRIGAQFDVSSIVEGSAKANEAFADVSRGLQNLTGSTEAATAAQVSEAESLDRVAAAAAAVVPELENEARASREAAAGSQSHAEANIQARLTTDLLTGNISRAENALIRFGSHSALIGPLMQAAFAPFAIIIFIEILEHAAEAIKKVTDGLMGNTEALKKAGEEAIKYSQDSESRALTLVQANAKIHSSVQELGTIAKETFGEKWQKATADAEGNTSHLQYVLKSFWDPFVGITPIEKLFTANKDAADRTVQVNKNLITIEQTKYDLLIQADRAQLKALEDEENAGKVGADASEARIAKLKVEIADLQKKQQLEEAIARAEMAKKGGGPVEQAEAVKPIGEDFKQKRIALTNELDTAEQEANARAIARQNERVKHDGDTLAGVQAMQREYVDMLVKDFDSEVKIREQEAEMFAATDRRDVGEAIKAAEEKVKAEAEYTAKVDRLAEDSALRQIAFQEAAVSANSRLKELQLEATSTTEFGRAAIRIAVNNQELADLKRLEEEKLAVQMKYLEDTKKILLGGQTEQQFVVNSTPEQLTKLAEVNSQIEAAQASHTARMDGYNRQLQTNTQRATDAMTAAYMKAFAPIDRAFEGTVQGILQGTLRVSEGFRRMGASIVVATVQSLAQALMHHIEHEIAVTLAHAASTQTQVAITASGAAQQQGILTIAHIKEILMHAKAAAAGAFHWVMSSVPFPLDVALAPAAAALAFAGTMAFAERGAIVPEDMPIFAHEKEMILPERISTPLQNVIPAMQRFNSSMDAPPASNAAVGAGARSGGETRDMHVNLHWHTLDSKSVSDFIHGNRAQFTKALRTAVRNGTGIE